MARREEENEGKTTARREGGRESERRGLTHRRFDSRVAERNEWMVCARTAGRHAPRVRVGTLKKAKIFTGPPNGQRGAHDNGKEKY